MTTSGTSKGPEAAAQIGLIERLPQGSRVLVIRLRMLGDCVLSTPAIRLLKQHRPDLEIGVVADPKLADVYRDNPDISSILPPSVRAIRAFRPKLCLNFHGGFRSVRLVLFSGARFRAAWRHLRFQWVYNTHVPTAQQILGVTRTVHTAEHMASVMFYLGVPFSEVPSAALYPATGRSGAAPHHAYAVIHPFASRPDKVWPTRKFLDLAHILRQDFDLEPVFVGSGGDNLSAFNEWKTAPGLALPELARLLRDADLFVGNDSGPAHLAAAAGAPEVVLFGPSSLKIWAPWRATAEVLKGRPDMDSITVGEVAEAAARVRLLMRQKVHQVR